MIRSTWLTSRSARPALVVGVVALALSLSAATYGPDPVKKPLPQTLHGAHPTRPQRAKGSPSDAQVKAAIEHALSCLAAPDQGGFVHCTSVDGWTFGPLRRYHRACENANRLHIPEYPIATMVQMTAHYTDGTDLRLVSPPPGNPQNELFVLQYKTYYRSWNAHLIPISDLFSC